MEQARILKVVVASPGDVQAERDALSEVISELNKQLGADHSLRLELYRWETDTHPGFHIEGPQGLIDDVLGIAECDLLICVFWKRFGTPTHDSQSGTEHEFRLAYNAWKTKGSPQIMIYFSQAPYSLRSRDEVEQLGRLIEFKEKLPGEGLWWTYDNPDAFVKLARSHLSQYIRQQARARQAVSNERPYVGRSLDELIAAYRAGFIQQVSTVRLFDGADLQPLERVFVELTITEEYERPFIHNAWLSLVDAELRRRRDVLAGEEDRVEGESKEKVVKIKRVVTPDSILHSRTQAVITGAPGCGKTTLIRYLALKTITDNNRFPVLLELKSVTERSFKAAAEDLVELLFAQVLSDQMQLEEQSEHERFRLFFIDRLRKGEVAIFLDGLDEVRGETFFPSLCKSVNLFMRSLYRSNQVFITTRPYALETRFEGLLEMEIAPLNVRQIQAFLDHYYANYPSVRQLPQHLRRHPELNDLARVPFLLGVIAELYRHQGQLVGARLELYRQIVKRLVVKLDKEKLVSRFLVSDEAGLLKRELLKHLAYERLFIDPADKDIERLVFTDDDIMEKAVRLCRPEIIPSNLVSDVIATPLLREVGARTYAFSHLTIQEYLAAEALSEESDFERIFFRSVFNPTIVSMEVLPMALGLIHDPNRIYSYLDELPESMTFTLLRLRGRSLAYAQKVDANELSKIYITLIRLLSSNDAVEVAWRDGVFRSFAAASNEIVESLIDNVSRVLLEDAAHHVQLAAIHVLGEIGNERAIRVLRQFALNNTGYDVSQAIDVALRKLGGTEEFARSKSQAAGVHAAHKRTPDTTPPQAATAHLPRRTQRPCVLRPVKLCTRRQFLPKRLQNFNAFRATVWSKSCGVKIPTCAALQRKCLSRRPIRRLWMLSALH